MPKKNFTLLHSSRYFTVAVLAAYFYAFMEWIFFITKPSFMDFLPTQEKINILMQAGLFISLTLFVLMLICALVNLVLDKFNLPSLQLQLFPAIALSSGMALILVDNFTYTVFNFGIISSKGERFLYLLLVGFFLYYFYQEFRRFLLAKKNMGLHNGLFKLTLVLLSISIMFTVYNQFHENSRQVDDFSVLGNMQKPNIIILGTDGLDASHMSLYGYERETTANTDQLAEMSLVSENHFSNACCTLGSTLSTLTGKLPLDTKTLTPPDILQGGNSYQHFIRFLNANGYSTMQWGNTVQVNGNKWNMRDGFSIINSVRKEKDLLNLFTLQFGNNTSYFINDIEGRLVERLLHILYIKNMEKPITSDDDINDNPESISDIQKIRSTVDFMQNSTQPFFIHMHLMGTHGGKFAISGRRHFSAGQVQNTSWNPDFMDDSILQYDQYVQRIITVLKKNGQFDNTIIIIYTDHGANWKADTRIPLVIYFPHGLYTGRITTNTQNLDIVPTLLDYMRVKQPQWMRGNSLLSPLNKDRLIFSFDVSPRDQRKQAPFFQFESMRIIQCQQIYLLNLKTGAFQTDSVDGHTTPCDKNELYTEKEIQDAMLKLLSEDGYGLVNIKSSP